MLTKKKKTTTGQLTMRLCTCVKESKVTLFLMINRFELCYRYGLSVVCVCATVSCYVSALFMSIALCEYNLWWITFVHELTTD